MKIPVSTGESMLRPEENTLAIMKWRLQQTAPASRWYPVLERYISYIAARVDGLGGQSAGIVPSPDGVPPAVAEKRHEYNGRVCEVIFGCFGDFEGFVLNDCHRSYSFAAREPAIREIVLRACRQRLPLTVYADDETGGQISRLVVRMP